MSANSFIHSFIHKAQLKQRDVDQCAVKTHNKMYFQTIQRLTNICEEPLTN